MSLRPNKKRRISPSPEIEADPIQDGNATEEEVDDAAAMHEEIWGKLLEGVEDLQEADLAEQAEEPPDLPQETVKDTEQDESAGLDLDAFLKQSLAQAAESDASVSPALAPTPLQTESVPSPAPEIFVSQPAPPARTLKSKAKLPLSPSPVVTALSPGLSPPLPPTSLPFKESPVQASTTKLEVPQNGNATGLQDLLDSFSNSTAELVKASLSPAPPAPVKAEPDIARAALQAAHLLTYFKHLLDHQITIAKRNGDAFNEEHAAYIVVETLRRAQLDHEQREALLIVFNQICQGRCQALCVRSRAD